MEEQAVVNSQIQQPPVKPITPKPNHWLIAIIIFVFIFIVGGVYVFVLQSQKQSPQPIVSPPSVSPTPDPTANWKTYTDVANGFSIKYPDNWNDFSVTDESGGYLLESFLAPQSEEPLYEKEEDYPPGIHIGVLKMKKCSDSADYAQTEVNTYLKNKDLYPGLDIHLLNLAGIHGYRINNGSPGTTAQRGPEVYIFNCKIETQISFNPAGIRNSEQLFDQILSTFQFTDQASAEGRVCGGPVLTPCPSGYTCNSTTIKSGNLTETSGKCVKEDQVVCTQDAKLCPDGSYVSRQPPNCEFAACP